MSSQEELQRLVAKYNAANLAARNYLLEAGGMRADGSPRPVSGWDRQPAPGEWDAWELYRLYQRASDLRRRVVEFKL